MKRNGNKNICKKTTDIIIRLYSTYTIYVLTNPLNHNYWQLSAKFLCFTENKQQNTRCIYEYVIFIEYYPTDYSSSSYLCQQSYSYMIEMYGHLGLQTHNTISYGAKQIQYIVQHYFLICNFICNCNCICIRC